MNLNKTNNKKSKLLTPEITGAAIRAAANSFTAATMSDRCLLLMPTAKRTSAPKVSDTRSAQTTQRTAAGVWITNAATICAKLWLIRFRSRTTR